MGDGESEFGPFFKALEIFKELFEEKIPIAMYAKLKQQVEKMLITKATMKIIDVDKFLAFVLETYMKYYINFNSPTEIIYNAWTLYERNAMSMNELYVTTELIKPLNILVDIPEEGKQTTISKDQFYSLFTGHFKNRSDELIYSHQYKEVLGNVDVFNSKRVKKLFELAPYGRSTNDFKQEFQEVTTVIKDKLNDIFKGKKWRQLNRLDEKSVWLHRLHTIQKSIGVVNTTLLKISLSLVKESIDFFLHQKKELLGGREDEDEEEVDNEGESELKQEPTMSDRPKYNKRTGSKNEAKIALDESATEKASVSQPRGAKKVKAITTKKFVSTDEKDNNTPRVVQKSDFAVPLGNKMLSSQKTTFFGSNKKAPRKASKL